MLTGPKHSGKTTFLLKLVEKLKREKFRIAGFTAPSVYEGTFLLGFDLYDIRRGQKVKLARRKSAKDEFEFSEEGRRFGRKILESDQTRNADLIIIDEFGPMELENGGWRKNIDLLLESKKCLLLIVREELVEKVKRIYSGLVCQTFSATEESVGQIISLLNKQGGKCGQRKDLR